jgi:hypothetical protein
VTAFGWNLSKGVLSTSSGVKRQGCVGTFLEDMLDSNIFLCHVDYRRLS